MNGWPNGRWPNSGVERVLLIEASGLGLVRYPPDGLPSGSQRLGPEPTRSPRHGHGAEANTRQAATHESPRIPGNAGAVAAPSPRPQTRGVSSPSNLAIYTVRARRSWREWRASRRQEFVLVPPFGVQARHDETVILHAVEHALVVVELDPDAGPPKVLGVGPDPAGNLVEVIWLALADDVDLVIHAMGLRPVFDDLLPTGDDPKP